MSSTTSWSDATFIPVSETLSEAFTEEEQKGIEILLKAMKAGRARILWSAASELYVAESRGSMSDASKRAPEEARAPPRGPLDIREVTHSPVTPSSDRPDNLPDDLRNISEWGDTLLTWGKYKSENLSYMELRDLQTKDSIAYCDWILSRRTSLGSSAELKDLAEYLFARKLADGKSSSIPGSVKTRVMKSPGTPQA